MIHDRRLAFAMIGMMDASLFTAKERQTLISWPAILISALGHAFLLGMLIHVVRQIRRRHESWRGDLAIKGLYAPWIYYVMGVVCESLVPSLSDRARDCEVIMEIETMGRVTVRAKIENLSDVYLAERQFLPDDQIRSLEVDDALVDTGASTLSLPGRLIRALELRPVRTRKALTSSGPVTVQMYGTVRLTIQERDCVTDVLELPDECPVLIGQIPLEQLDFVVDMTGQRLIGNPAHGGEHVIELY